MPWKNKPLVAAASGDYEVNTLPLLDKVGYCARLVEEIPILK